MKKTGWYAVLGMAAGLAATPTLACAPRFVQPSQTVQLTAVEVGANTETRENFQIRIRNENTGQCSASLRFSRLTTGVPGDAFGYRLESAGQTIDILPNEITAPSTNSDLFVAGIPGGGRNGRAVPFRLELPTEWGIASGSSSDTILVQMIDPVGDVVDTLALTIGINVLPAVELRIVGATGNDRIARIDLGALDARRSNRSDPFGIRVWSTSPYSVTYESENLGRLAHDTASDRIEYELLASGRAVDPSGTLPGSFGQKTTALGDFWPLEITVAPFTARAGGYSDRVTITVTAS